MHAVGEFDRTPLHRAAARLGGSWLVGKLLEAGADVDARDAIGMTPLHVAADQCCPENLEELLGFSPALEARDQDGRTALHLAAWHTPAAVGPLLAAGANAKAEDRYGRTPLHAAMTPPGPSFTETGERASSAEQP